MWHEWVKGVLAGSVLSGLLFAVYSALVPGTVFTGAGVSLSGVTAGAFGGAVVGLAPAAAASLLGVFIARRMGWNRQWVSGMLFTPIALAIAFAFFSTNGAFGGLTLG